MDEFDFNKFDFNKMVNEYEFWEAPSLCISAYKKLYETCKNRMYFKYLNMIGYIETETKSKTLLYYYEGAFDNTAIPQKGIAVQTITYHDNDKANINTKFLPIVHTLSDTVHIQVPEPMVKQTSNAPSLCWGRAKKVRAKIYDCENIIYFSKLVFLGGDTLHDRDTLLAIYYYEKPLTLVTIPKRGIVIENIKQVKEVKETNITLEFVSLD